MSLFMSNHEIIWSYTHAKNRVKQIGILADLNGCNVDIIKDILHKAGVLTQSKKKEKK